MKIHQLVQIALKAGEILLCSGAEIYRVEETILRIFKSYNTECECFALLSGIFLSARDENGETITEIKRLKGYTINLHKIDLINSFSRNLEKHPLSYTDAMDALKVIGDIPSYKFLLRLVCAGIMAFVYTLLFKGQISEAGAALIIGIIVFTVKVKISSLGMFQFFEYLISGIVAGLMCLMAVVLAPSLDVYKIIIGSIMILVPGMAITSGIKDALYGDIVSSLYRLAEALFISIAVGAGVGIVLSFGLRWIYG